MGANINVNTLSIYECVNGSITHTFFSKQIENLLFGRQPDLELIKYLIIIYKFKNFLDQKKLFFPPLGAISEIKTLWLSLDQNTIY